jgi:hypothetical protein
MLTVCVLLIVRSHSSLMKQYCASVHATSSSLPLLLYMRTQQAVVYNCFVVYKNSVVYVPEW